MAEVEVSTLNGRGSPPLLRMTGEFDMSNIALVDDVLTLWTEQGHREAVVDLSDATFIDSTTIGAIARAHVRGLSITVRGASGSVDRALTISGLADVVTLEPPL